VDELRGVLRGRIWIGALLPAGGLDVPGLLARFSQAHPGVEVGLREGIAGDMLRFLATDELDAAFCLLSGEVPDDLAVERLSEEEAVAAFAPGRAPAASHVGVADLRERAIVATRRGSAITSAVEQLFADAGERLRLSLESGDPFLLRSLAARGFATAILPRSLTAMEGPAIEVRSLHPAVRPPVALVWRRERNAPPAARMFIDCVRRETAVTDGRPRQ
jgi:DNA-binding transcriptional LysR family regulator